MRSCIQNRYASFLPRVDDTPGKRGGASLCASCGLPQPTVPARRAVGPIPPLSVWEKGPATARGTRARVCSSPPPPHRARCPTAWAQQQRPSAHRAGATQGWWRRQRAGRLPAAGGAGPGGLQTRRTHPDRDAAWRVVVTPRAAAAASIAGVCTHHLKAALRPPFVAGEPCACCCCCGGCGCSSPRLVASPCKGPVALRKTGLWAPDSPAPARCWPGRLVMAPIR